MTKRPSLWGPATALAAAILVTVLAMILLSDRPGRALEFLFIGPVRTPFALGNLLERVALLTLTGTAAALAFRSGSFNLGGEGQALAGGLSAAAIALAFPGLPRLLAIPTALAAALLAGGSLGAFSGWLKGRWNVDELISTFLLANAIRPIGEVLLSGPMKDETSYLIAAAPLPEAYLTGSWLPPSNFGPVALWTLIIWGAAVLFLSSTRKGYEWRLKGANERFARYGGIRTDRISLWSLALSGALMAFAGASALLGRTGQAVQGFTSGLGWDGLAVALIAGTNPAMVPVAALAYAWLAMGTQAAQFHTGFPYALGSLVQAVVFLLVSARYLRRRSRR